MTKAQELRKKIREAIGELDPNPISTEKVEEDNLLLESILGIIDIQLTYAPDKKSWPIWIWLDGDMRWRLSYKNQLGLARLFSEDFGDEDVELTITQLSKEEGYYIKLKPDQLPDGKRTICIYICMEV